MSNLFKYVENLFNADKKTSEHTQVNDNSNNNNKDQAMSSKNKANYGLPKELQSANVNNMNMKNNFYNNNNNNNNNKNISNKIGEYSNLRNLGNTNNNKNSSCSNSNSNTLGNLTKHLNFDIFKKRKEIKENTNEESSIKIWGENQHFSLDLKVFGMSIFQNLILTVTATGNNVNTNRTKLSNNYNSENSIIPIKCTWKRFKNDTEISISNINTNSYIPTAEDIGYTLLVEAVPVDTGLYGEQPLYGQYGPIGMDLNIKNTLELLLTSGGTKFSCFLFDNESQEKKTDREIIVHINSVGIKLTEIDYNGKEKILESVKLHHLNPHITLNTKDSQRFYLKFFKFDFLEENENSKASIKGNNKQNNLTEKDFTKLKQEIKSEYDLIAMSKQCRELIYLLIQIFLIDEKLNNSKLFTCANYNLLPQDTKIGVTDLITEIKTLREENNVLINNMKILSEVNCNLKQEMKDLEEEFQASLETINSSIRMNAYSDTGYNSANNSNCNNSNRNSSSNFNNNNFISGDVNNINHKTSNYNNAQNNLYFCSKCQGSSTSSNSNPAKMHAENITSGGNAHSAKSVNAPINNSNNSNKNVLILNNNIQNNKININTSADFNGKGNLFNKNNGASNGNYIELKNKYDELKELNLNLISKEKALREENQELTLKLEISKNSINELASENKRLKSDLNQANSDLSSLNKNNVVLLEQKNKLQVKYDSLEKEKENLSNMNTELRTKVTSLASEENLKFRNLNEMNEKKLEELNKKNETLNYEIKNLIIQRNLLTNQKDNLTKEFEKLKNEKSKTEASEGILREEIENLKQLIKEKEKVNLSLNSEAQASKKQINDLKQKYEILEIEHSTLKENFDKNFLNFNDNNNAIHPDFQNNNNNCYINNQMIQSFDNNQDKNMLNDSLRYSNLPSDFNYSNNKLYKISSEELEDYENLKREKDENEALMMQLRSNSQAKDLEIASLKAMIDNLKKSRK